MKLLLIAGHGAGDPGATATYAGKRYREADETRDLAARLSSELKKRYEITVTQFDPAKNAYTELQRGRSLAASFSGCDYALELHFNASGANAADGRRKGTECYIPVGGEAGPAAALCTALQPLGFPNRGVKQKNFAVISAAKRAGVPAALLEVCFLDDPDDCSLWLQNKDAVAAAIADGLCRAFSLPLRQQRTSREIVQTAAGLSDGTMDYLASYRWGKELLNKLADAVTHCRSSFS